MAEQPAIFLPHGGGPCFFMDWTMGPADTWDPLADWLRGVAATLPARPRAVVVVSGHWEEDAFAVTAGTQPPLIYDYYGFPEQTYALQYPAPGDPVLAVRIVALLTSAGLASRTDETRGFDHGVFIPFMLMLPDADIPVVQVSLHRGLDPAMHIAAGRALAELRQDGVLIIGSGMSYHNMQGFGTAQAATDSLTFDQWLTDAVSQGPARRAEALTNWTDAPAARVAHPREEHLLPLMVAAGADSDGPGAKVFSDNPMNATISAYRFGGALPENP